MTAGNVIALRPGEEPRFVDESGYEDMPVVMSPKTLSEQLDIAVPTLERMRVAKTGPAWHTIPGSRLVRYSRADVVAWLRANRVPSGEHHGRTEVSS